MINSLRTSGQIHIKQHCSTLFSILKQCRLVTKKQLAHTVLYFTLYSIQYMHCTVQCLCIPRKSRRSQKKKLNFLQGGGIQPEVSQICTAHCQEKYQKGTKCILQFSEFCSTMMEKHWKVTQSILQLSTVFQHTGPCQALI